MKRPLIVYCAFVVWWIAATAFSDWIGLFPFEPVEDTRAFMNISLGYWMFWWLSRPTPAHDNGETNE